MSAGSPRDKRIRLRIAANLQHLMEKRGFSSERALARKLGVNASTVGRALKADRCGLDLLVAVHRKLGVSLDWLVDENEGVAPMPPEPEPPAPVPSPPTPLHARRKRPVPVGLGVPKGTR